MRSLLRSMAKITRDQKRALDRAIRFLSWVNATNANPELEKDIAVLHDMMKEAV